MFDDKAVLPPTAPPESRRPDAIQAGPGSCGARGCNCGGFRPTGRGNDVCAYCGHMWQIHRG